MTATAGPVAESVFALDLFVRNSSIAFTGWRRHVRRQLGQRLTAVEQLARSCPPLPDLLELVTAADRGGDGLAGHQRRQVLSVLSEFRRAAVLPYWGRIRLRMIAERDARARIVLAKGVEHLLSTLHPRVRWSAPTLELPDQRQLDIHLDGSGLLLSPSLFLSDQPGITINTERRNGSPTLAFRVPLTATAAAMLLAPAETNEHALSALVGHTRAAALQVLTETCTTSELAQRLNISSAGASQHATILRDAGLITTCRDRNTVLHSVTSLGMALLHSADQLPVAISGQ